MRLTLIIMGLHRRRHIEWFKADLFTVRSRFYRPISGAELRHATMLEF